MDKNHKFQLIEFHYLLSIIISSWIENYYSLIYLDVKYL